MLGDVQVICGSMIRESCQPQLKPWCITYVKFWQTYVITYGDFMVIVEPWVVVIIIFPKSCSFARFLNVIALFL